VNDLLSHYPAAAGAHVRVVQGVVADEQTPLGPGIPVQWPMPEVPADAPTPSYVASLVRNRVPQYRYRREHWLVPVVGDTSDILPPTLLWWVLLFGLSLLARYEPAAWRHALDPDESRIAVLLEALLDEALTEMPRLLTEALIHQELLESARI
jgi:hypothetical protein